MSLIRNVGVRTLHALVQRARPEVREWGLAMLREVDYIESDWTALFWSIGSVKSVISVWKGSDAMRGQVNRVSGKVVVALSLIALFCVFTGYLHPAHQAEPDEGAAAHIFQLSIVAVVATILVFFATADWKQPLRSARPLVLPAGALALAFAALYYLEHYYLAP